MKNTRNKKWVRWALIAVLVLFGGLTLFLSTSILFDLFGIREKEGEYVPFVVLANFIASIGYFAAAMGLLAHRLWARYPLWMASVALLMASVGFAVHLLQGGIHESHTIVALAFRTVLTIGFYATAVWLIRAQPQKLHPTTEQP
ncbi:MAG: hypothetical protein IPN44_10615 [Flavobacteriales bacterium]|nr:hypothetical protein [Flavobacteriales bacterium]